MGVIKRYATEDYVEQQITAIDIPTKVSSLENDAGYLTKHQDLSNYYTKIEVNDLHSDLHDYVDQEVAALVSSAPETLDTLGELAAAFEENQEVVDALNMAIATRVKTINGVGIDTDGNIDVREVPKVTETDNGKFLVVVNGVWSATAIDNGEELSW